MADDIHSATMLAHAKAPFDLASIYDAQLDYVWNSLRRLGVAAADAEDLCHEVFLIVQRRSGSYDSTSPLRAWLFGIAYRVAANYRRHSHQRREVVSDWIEAESAAPQPDVAVEQARDRALVRRALETLPVERRAVFVLHDLDEIAAPDVAQALGLPLNTVYSRLRVGRTEFATAVLRLRSTR